MVWIPDWSIYEIEPVRKDGVNQDCGRIKYKCPQDIRRKECEPVELLKLVQKLLEGRIRWFVR